MYAMSAFRSVGDKLNAAPCPLPGTASGGVRTARIASFVVTSRCCSGTATPNGLSGLLSSAQQPDEPGVQLMLNSGSGPTAPRPAEPLNNSGNVSHTPRSVGTVNPLLPSI